MSSLNDGGFSLLEVLIGTIISVMIVAFISSSMFISEEHLKQFENNLEDSAMFAAITRTMEQDAHASSSAQFSYGNITFNRMSGGQFTYYVNANRQLIRYQSNGGVAVIGSNVKQISETVINTYLQVRVTLVDGASVVVGMMFGGD